MQRIIAARLEITGALADESFVGWIVERARRLSLSGAVRRISEANIEVTVEGPEALVDAMELACSLGPASVLVDGIVRKPCDGLPGNGAGGSTCTSFVQMP